MHLILSAIGPDRPGLVDEVSQFIFEHGGNIEDSRMVNLRGQFAMMVLIGGDEKTLAVLRGELGVLGGKTALQIDLRPAQPASPAYADALPYRLVATAIDQPGLVHRISHVLREMSINIESLDTRLTAAPYTGAPMFEMEMVLSVPRKTHIAGLRQRIAALGDELNIDCRLTAGLGED